eukprot:scaffold10807_cov369-Chaetoceros_neogracile.AAC.1
MYENLTVNAYASVTVEVEVRSSYLKKRGIVVGHFEVDDEVPAVGPTVMLVGKKEQEEGEMAA